MLKLIGLILGGILLLLGVSAVYVRLAPVDPARWHTSPATARALADQPCADAILVSRSSAEAHCQRTEPALQLLGRLDDAAMATARTRRIAGSPEEGMITWETRSSLWAFPDYTTARAREEGGLTLLDITARSRFGQYDYGVNAARLRAWLDGV